MHAAARCQSIDKASLSEDRINVRSLEQRTKDELFRLIEEYRICFSVNNTNLGCTTDDEVHTEIVDDKPITYTPYRIAHSERGKCKP